MANVIYVNDPNDSRLIDFRDLSRADRRPDRPGGRGLVIAEGSVIVRRLLDSRYRLRSVFGVEHRIRELADDLVGHDVPSYVADPDIIAEVLGFPLNRGVIAVADRPEPLTLGEVVVKARVLAVLEGVRDHENLGAIFRNAAAFGLDGIVLAPDCADPLYRRSVRVSMGHALRIPFTTLGSWPLGLTKLRERGFTVLALTPRAGAISLNELRVKPSTKLAILLGSEGAGLSEDALRMADECIRIPMAQGVDSLNVATAGAIAFHGVTCLK